MDVVELSELLERAVGDAVHVMVGVISGKDGEILISHRSASQHQGGLWEFPGGKREVGESRWGALSRELHEELGIEVEAAHPLLAFKHDYADKTVFLDVWHITAFSGTASGREGQAIKWVQADELSNFDFPEANKAILKTLRMPNGIWITPSADYGDWADVVTQVARMDGVAIRYRAPALASSAEYIEKAEHLSKDWPNVRWVWCCEPTLWSDLPAGDIHLSSQLLSQLSTAQLIASEENQRLLQCLDARGERCLFSVGHSAQELAAAESIGADGVLISPVLPTLTHTGTRPVGWSQFADFALGTSMSVYALGGVAPKDLGVIRECGGRGWAGIRWAMG